jgi:hypothetical protein
MPKTKPKQPMPREGRAVVEKAMKAMLGLPAQWRLSQENAPLRPTPFVPPTKKSGKR